MAAAGGRGGGRGALGRWLLTLFIILLVFSLGVRYRSTLSRGGQWLQGMLQELGSSDPPPELSAGTDGEQPGEMSAPLSLQILNATGIRDLALETGQRLRRWNIDVIDRGNAPPWPFPETMLIIRSGGGERVAELSERLGDLPVIIQRRDDLVLDATLILGHDWEKYLWPEDKP